MTALKARFVIKRLTEWIKAFLLELLLFIGSLSGAWVWEMDLEMGLEMEMVELDWVLGLD